MLTFGKTSLQSDHIGPATPRAIYFNDTVHVGFVKGANTVLEIAVADRTLGTVFYTLDQSADTAPKFERQTNRCLNCHGGERSRGVPGLLVRSIFADPQGRPVVAAGSYRTDHTSPLSQRWGGWYVTGSHGTETHLGNFTLPNAKKPKTVDNKAGQNITDLGKWIEPNSYLSGHSDIVALMILEHQIDAINYITRLRFESRLALPKQEQDRVTLAVDQLIRHSLFAGEAKLKAPIKGTSEFARDFEKQGPTDKKGRSLAQLDLTTRLFKYPCSYAIYSEAFDTLSGDMKALVYRGLWNALTAEKPDRQFAHLTAADREAIREILRDTKRDLPAYWR